MTSSSVIETIEQRPGQETLAGNPSPAYKWPTALRSEAFCRFLALLTGAILGLSAPGIEQWYLAWCAFAPVIVLAVTAREPWYAGVRGWFFFTGYNLVALHFCLSVRQELFEGIFSLITGLSVLVILFIIAALKGMLGSIFCLWLKAIPMTGGFLPLKNQGRWLMPGFLVIPLLWVVIDYLCYPPEFLGVRWTSFEYSQYRQLPLIQLASITGGAGITICLILSNLTLLGIIGFCTKRIRCLTYPNSKALLLNTTLSVLLLTAVINFGNQRINSENAAFAKKKKLTVSAIQSNLCQKIHKVDFGVIHKKNLELTKECPPNSIVIWPEWSFPAVFSKGYSHLEPFSKPARDQNQSWVLGCIDEDKKGQHFNSTIVMDKARGTLPMVYHKRYLVPFGEFTPKWVKETPFGWILYGQNKTYEETASGNTSVCFPLEDVVLGPMLCFECEEPSISRDSVRDGAQLLVDSSYTGWFHNSILSDQMIAFCVMRSVENHRSFVFSTTLGPSAIIDSTGRILRQAPREESAAITAEVPIESDTTLFTQFSF